MPIQSMLIQRVALAFAVAAVAAVALSACAASPASREPAAGSVVIVVAADGVDVELSRGRMTEMLERACIDAGLPPPVPGSMVALALGDSMMSVIGDELAVRGALSQASREKLAAMPVPVHRALLVRLERNETEVLEPRTEPALSADGRRLDDRDTIVLSQRRHMRVAAALIDLHDGMARWQRAWDAAPIASLRYVDYSGSSLAASVAATLANTVVSGLQGPSAPPAVGARETLQALFDEMAAEVPGG